MTASIRAGSSNDGFLQANAVDALRFEQSGDVTASRDLIAGRALSIPNDPAWTVVAAAVFPTTGAFGNASGSFTYKRIGKTLFFRAKITITSNGTGAGSVNLTLPIAANAAPGEWNFIGRENGVAGFPVVAYIFPSAASTLTLYKMDTTYPGANGYVLNITGFYETP